MAERKFKNFDHFYLMQIILTKGVQITLSDIMLSVWFFIIYTGGFYQMRNKKTLMLVEGAVMTALATVLCFIRIIKFPWGGSVTMVSMLPIMLYSIKYGVKNGLAVSFLFSLIQLCQGISDGLFGWGLTPISLIACILIDYIGAYSIIGIAGIFKEKGIKGWYLGITVAGFSRFIFHFISGVVIWHSFGELWENFSTDNEWLYSLLYNGAYMLPEILFTLICGVVLFKVPYINGILNKKISVN